jgi:NAD(P)-dependent dehydrogenase (short-subunit alcohol dehydrogenase family)
MPDSIQHLLDSVTKELGVVHAMVANAGIATLQRFVDLPLSEWDEIMRVNARGVFLCGQIFARHMLDHGGGRIVNISSQAGHQGQALVAHYCASKAAILGLTKAMALELAPRVQVNAVCPGIVETDMIAADFRRQSEILGLHTEEVARRTLARIPLGHFQSATSVAAAVAFLLSEAAADITGQAIHVNGGMTTC